MAFGRLERHRAQAPMSDINMTPLIDVMLVLLVIFMIAAPLMTSKLKLDLPKANGAPTQTPKQPLRLGLDAEGTLYLGDERITADELATRAAAAAKTDPTTEVQLRADVKVPYGRVAELIGQLQAAGLSRIGFITSTAAPSR
ncbi:MAG: biopolymer transporter ExbD [Burkholderiales bacterium PBB6]|nr:MAG: biopolymer transporter ExbD [Burkholderiales bacterium PBB6]